MEEYKVGQILFLIGTKSTRIIPVQITEEVVRTTVEGKQKTYTVMLPDKIKTTVDIKEIKGELFKTWQDLRIQMLANATKAIDNMITKAVNISENVFNISKDDKLELLDNDTLNDKNVQHDENHDIIKVDLGNGQVGNMSVETFNKAGAK